MPDYHFGEPLANLPSDVVLPEISVKNTFICCDDPDLPPSMDLQRSVTDSAQASRGGPLDPALYPPTIPETFDGDDDYDDSPPTPMAMTRAITQDNVESHYEWSWAFDRDAGDQGPPMPQPQDQQQFMMAMPAMSMMPPPQAGGPGQPQMAVYMVPMRGIRWPDEAPAQGGPAPSMPLPPGPMGPPGAGSQPNTVVPPPQINGNNAGSSSGGYGGNNAGTSSAPKKEITKYPVSEEPPALQPLTRAFSVGSGAFRINWTLSATKLRSADKNAVSPAFELSFGGAYSSTKFKLMLLPQVSSEGKGGSTFRKSDGKGYILLKCEADLQEGCGNLRFRLFVGSQAPRGPVTHDFSQSAVKGLPKDLETWDLLASVKNGHVVLGAEIIPMGAC
jgi:hypothetical protein